MKRIKVYISENIKNIVIILLLTIMALAMPKIQALSIAAKGTSVVEYRIDDARVVGAILQQFWRTDTTPDIELFLIRDAIYAMEKVDIPFHKEIRSALDEAEAVWMFYVERMKTDSKNKEYFDLVRENCANLGHILAPLGTIVANTNDDLDRYFYTNEAEIMESIRQIDRACYHLINGEEQEEEYKGEFDLADGGRMVVTSYKLVFYNHHKGVKELTIRMNDGTLIKLMNDGYLLDATEEKSDAGTGEGRVQKILVKEAIELEKVDCIILNGVEYPY
jgi:hypothetical protein